MYVGCFLYFLVGVVYIEELLFVLINGNGFVVDCGYY